MNNFFLVWLLLALWLMGIKFSAVTTSKRIRSPWRWIRLSQLGEIFLLLCGFCSSLLQMEHFWIRLTIFWQDFLVVPRSLFYEEYELEVISLYFIIFRSIHFSLDFGLVSDQVKFLALSLKKCSSNECVLITDNECFPTETINWMQTDGLENCFQCEKFSLAACSAIKIQFFRLFVMSFSSMKMN